MSFTPAGGASVAAFVAIVAAVILAFVGAVLLAFRRDPARQRVIVIAAAVYLALITAFVGLGGLERLPMQGFPFFFGAVLVVSLGAGLSSLGSQLAAAVPLAGLVAFQSFRLPLELVLHAWAAQGTVPVTMTWTGQNWDIVSGVVALAAAPFAGRRGVAWTVNVIGIVLLINVMRVAVLSSPLPFAWGVTPPLLLALYLPYAWIGPVCVGGALFGHVVLTRKLLGAAGSRLPTHHS